MTDRDKTISPPGSPPGGPLRRRMSEDMTVRGFTPCTQRGYIRQPFTRSGRASWSRETAHFDPKATCGR